MDGKECFVVQVKPALHVGFALFKTPQRNVDGDNWRLGVALARDGITARPVTHNGDDL